MKWEIHYQPAECAHTCEDNECPYVHTEGYYVTRNNKYFEGGFNTKQEAQNCIDQQK